MKSKFIKPLVLVGPSGSGKTTLYDHLKKLYPQKLVLSVSSTTRKPRNGEVNGVHYHFVTMDEFKKEVTDEKFLEYFEVHGNCYGTHTN